MNKIQRESKVVLFQNKQIRRFWDEKGEKWWFSVVDIIGVLTDSSKPRVYWNAMKTRVKSSDGFQLSTICRQLKLESSDGKKYETDCADTEGILRIIQSIPSPKAEPFKMWLAKVGYERIEESEDPELAIQRAMRFYLKRGYSKNWVNQRLKSIEVRKELTDEWENRGVSRTDEFADLTDEITFAWAGMKTRNYKNYKGLKKENLRDNMTNLELVLNMLAEASTTEISKKVLPKNFFENKKIAQEGGSIAGDARRKIEKRTGKKVVVKLNARELKLIK